MLTSRHFRRRHQRGASLVELALVLFILLFIFAGIVDFGRVFNHYTVITNASREGARYASHAAPAPSADLSVRQAYKTKILQAVKQEAAGSSVELDDDNIDIDPDPVDGSPAAANEPITVTVDFRVPTIIAEIADFGSLPLRARTTMVVSGLD